MPYVVEDDRHGAVAAVNGVGQQLGDSLVLGERHVQPVVEQEAVARVEGGGMPASVALSVNLG
ncbi:MAG: hypothetical protein WKF54_14110 [Nocardioidaceae bacterium]